MMNKLVCISLGTIDKFGLACGIQHGLLTHASLILQAEGHLLQYLSAVALTACIKPIIVLDFVVTRDFNTS